VRTSCLLEMCECLLGPRCNLFQNASQRSAGHIVTLWRLPFRAVRGAPAKRRRSSSSLEEVNYFLGYSLCANLSLLRSKQGEISELFIPQVTSGSFARTRELLFASAPKQQVAEPGTRPGFPVAPVPLCWPTWSAASRRTLAGQRLAVVAPQL
jgi:hypothetical protein